MPVFTGIGLAVGAGAATAFSVGIGVTALAVAVGVGAYALGGGFDSKSDDRIDTAVGTGQLTDAEAKRTAQKRAYRSGVLFTSPTGLDSSPKTSSAKLR